MTAALTFRRTLIIGAHTLAWCGLWRSVSAANLVTGVAIATGVSLSGLGTPGRGGIKLVPLVKLAWIILVDLVTSTIDVAVEILTRTDGTEEGIVAVSLPSDSRQHLLLLIIAITLTPGTAVVDADADTGTLYLHLLHIDRRAATVAHVEDLARLAVEALPLNTTGVLT
jgi:multicomponent Na+:H+ antiporter subunit E